MTQQLFVWHGENFTAKIYTSIGVEQYWRAQIFKKLRSHPRILSARRVTCSKFHAEVHKY
jgi:hypothetical protein